MKRLKFGAVLALALGGAMLLSACGSNGTKISYYSGDELDANGNLVFNEELFYLNENKGPGPDPFVLDDTSRSGYYYIGSTLGEFMLYRSKDMMTMEAVGPSLDIKKGTDKAIATADSRWAPEYLYDEDDGCYYMFFSCKPTDTNSYTVSGGVVNSDTAGARNTGYNIAYIARSETPEGPYEMVDFTSEEAVEGGWSHDLNTSNAHLTQDDVNAGLWGVDGTTHQLVDPDSVDDFTQLYRPSYPQVYAKYAYLDPAAFASAGMAMGKANAQTNAGYSNSIDLHPYIDPATGYKYLYLTMNEGYNYIVGLQMAVEEDGSSSWLKPDWSTFTIIAAPHYWTVEDYLKDTGEGGPNLGSWPNDDGDLCYDWNTNINEGTTVIEHNGKYYLTFSFGAYTDETYQVAQAVADSPLGSFRKLNEEENGILLSGQTEGSEQMSGTGHHAIITIGEQMFIYYHSHNSYTAMGADRHGNIDELKWVTIKDYQGNDLDVLVANGPTATIQPRIEKYAKYVNLAEDATITLKDASALEEDSSLKWLNDGLLSLYKNGDVKFYDKYVQETRINKTATFEVTLDKASAVRAVMVYDSKYEEEAFVNISRMEFETKDGKVYYLEGVSLPSVYYTKSEYTGEIRYISPGAAAFAEFHELADIAKVRITVEVPEGQEVVGISEIRILGK